MGFRDFIASAKETVRAHSHHNGEQPHEGVQQQQPDQQWPHRSSDTIPEFTQQAIAVCLLSSHPDGGIGGIGYWQVANAYTAILLHDLWARAGQSLPYHDKHVRFIANQTHKVLSNHQHCINEFNDDTLWWGHVLLLLHDATNEQAYLQHALAMHSHLSKYVIAEGARDVLGKDLSGGVLWKSESGCQEVNSISTGLYAEFVALLAKNSASERNTKHLPSAVVLLQAAAASVEFIFRCLYDERSGVILDTIKRDTGERIDWAFSYTTGQTIAACVAIHSAALSVSNDRGDDLFRAKAEGLLARAVHLARTAIRRAEWVDGTNDAAPGVLTERGAYGPDNHKASDNDDAVGFKSVLVRSLVKLYLHLVLLPRRAEGAAEVLPGIKYVDVENLRNGIKELVQRTYDSLRTRASNEIGQYGPWWAGPMDMPTSHSQMAVLDIMAAMRAI